MSEQTAKAGDAPGFIPTPVRVRRRRPPNAAEQARRVAWGRKFGAINKALYERAIREAGG